VRRNCLFSKIHILQHDSAGSIRNYAWQVWKSLVYNNTRILHVIVESYVEESIKWLSSEEHDREVVRV
jgi:transposase